MLSEKDNETLSRVGPGTPMGDLLRRYWQPVAASQELEDAPFRTKELMILGEELVLYKDRRGTLGLLDRYCSHRRVNLAIGVVEDEGIRCQYHGWRFDETGACVEQPFEDTMHPETLFRQKCSLTAYPVKELAGLVFAYMGPLPAPELPCWEPLTWTNAVRDIAVTELPCNWLQCQENSVDPIHNEWLHNYFGNYVAHMRREESFAYIGTAGRPTKKIAFDPFDYGIIKRRMVEGDTGEEEDWKVGHPILFPNVLLTGNQFGYTMQFRVPIDDERTYHVSQYIFHAAPGQEAPVQSSVPYRVVPLREDEKNWILNYTFNQDYMAWFTQGAIAKRHLEKLGESDRGVILFRFMLQEQMERVREGEDPINTFHDAEKARCISFPMEKVKHGRTIRPTYRPGEAGYSRDADLIEQTLATWDAIPEHRREPVAAI